MNLILLVQIIPNTYQNVNQTGCASLGPACTPDATSQWVGRSGPCPAGYTGTQTWEVQQTRTSVCNSTYGSPTNSAWTDTSNTRNLNQTGCTPIYTGKYVRYNKAYGFNYAGGPDGNYETYEWSVWGVSGSTIHYISFNEWSNGLPPSYESLNMHVDKPCQPGDHYFLIRGNEMSFLTTGWICK